MCRVSSIHDPARVGQQRLLNPVLPIARTLPAPCLIASEIGARVRNFVSGFLLKHVLYYSHHKIIPIQGKQHAIHNKVCYIR